MRGFNKYFKKYTRPTLNSKSLISLIGISTVLILMSGQNVQAQSDISVSPLSFNKNLDPGNSTFDTLTISNDGVSALDFEISRGIEDMPGIVSYWKMDEASWSGVPGEVVDFSGNGLNGQAESGASTTEGKFSRCGSFDGINDQVRIPYTSVDFEGGYNDFTTMFWAIPDYSVTGAPLSKGYWKGDGFYWIVDAGFPNNPMMFFLSNAGDRVYVNIDPDEVEYRDGNWHHFVSVRKDGWVSFYIDGIFVQNVDWSGFSVTAATRDMYLGYEEKGLTHYKGKLDDVALFNRALSPEEISTLYNAKIESWLSVDASTGTVVNGIPLDVTVTIDATDLSTGTYNADIKIINNDPDENPTTVPVSLNVSEASPAPVKLINTASNSIIKADGMSNSIITSRICDSGDNLVGDATNNVTFSISGEGTLTAPTLKAAIGGIVTVEMKSTITVGTAIITATASGLSSGNVAVETFGSASKLVNTASPLNLLADGISTSLITAQAADQNDNPVTALSSGSGFVGAWSGWTYRKPVTISNTSGSALSNFQVDVLFTDIGTAGLISGGKMESDYADVRFTDDGDNELAYWIDTDRFWVKVTNIPTSPDTTLYVYYGNAGASGVSNGENTFDFFDDFLGSDVDAKWTEVSTNGYYSVSNSELRLYTDAAIDANQERMVADWTTSEDSIIETKIKSAGIYRGGIELLKSDDATIMTSTNGSEVAIHNIGGNDRYFFNNVNSGTPVTGTWYLARNIVRGGLADGYFYDMNGTELYAETGAAIDGLATIGKVRIGAWNDTTGDPVASDYTYDWVRIRKYASAEPAETIGAEEEGSGVGAVTFSVTGPGTLLGTTVNDLVDGVVTAILRSTLAGGTATVTSTVESLAQGAVQVIMTEIATKILGTANSTSITADGVNTSLVTVSICSDSNTLMTSATNTVTFSVTGPGTLLNTTIKAASGGMATVMLRSTTTIGTATVAATTSGLLQGDVLIETTVGSPFKLISTANPSVISSDGLSTALITTGIYDSVNHLIVTSNNDISFSVAGEGTLIGTTLIQASGGVATIGLRSTTSAGFAYVASTSSGLMEDEAIITTITTPVKVLSTASPVEIIANGVSTSLITSFICSANDEVISTVSGVNMSFSISGEGALLGTTKQVLNGVATIILQSTITSGTAVVTATTDGLAEGIIDIGTFINNSPFSPVNPQCQWEESPACIVAEHPKFSWTFSDPDTGRDNYQESCRILVADNQSGLDADIGNVWDTDKIAFSGNEIIFSGSTLEIGTTYYWKVMVWDNYDAASSYNLSQSFYRVNKDFDYIEKPAVNEYVGGGIAQEWNSYSDSYYYELPFVFDFYGKRNAMSICTNGFITFDEYYASLGNSDEVLETKSMIAPLWDDIITNGIAQPGEDVYIHQPSSDSVCVRWCGETLTAGNPVNFETILYEDGTIKFNYGSGNTGLTPTVGLSYGTGEAYLQATHNGEAVLSNTQTSVFEENTPPDTPYNMLCEGIASPAFISSATPEFSWIFSDPDGVLDGQSAYRLIVSDNLGSLDSNIGNMWDTGKVLSVTENTTYTGSSLDNNTTYFWKVMVWDNSDYESSFCIYQEFKVVGFGAINLLCQGQENPDGIKVEKPMFSWTFEDYGAGLSQSAYRILIADSLFDLEVDNGDMWDSGKVISTACVNIECAGEAFSPNSEYYWKVMVWNNLDQPSSFCQEQSFGMGDYSVEFSYNEVLIDNEFIGGGIPQGWQGDDRSYYYTLPFTFDFYGQKNSVWICTNGFIDFTSSNSSYNDSIYSLSYRNMIAPLWDDLETNSGDIYIHQPTADSVCFRWEGTRLGYGYPVNFEVVLHDDGTIKFNYGTGNSHFYPTIGVSCGNVNNYLLSIYNYDGYLDNVQTSRISSNMTRAEMPASLSMDKKGIFSTGLSVEVTVEDVAANTDNYSIQQVTVTVTSPTDPDGEIITLTETYLNNGIFKGVLGFEPSPVPLNGDIGIIDDEFFTATYNNESLTDPILVTGYYHANYTQSDIVLKRSITPDYLIYLQQMEEGLLSMPESDEKNMGIALVNAGYINLIIQDKIIRGNAILDDSISILQYLEGIVKDEFSDITYDTSPDIIDREAINEVITRIGALMDDSQQWDSDIAPKISSSALCMYDIITNLDELFMSFHSYDYYYDNFKEFNTALSLYQQYIGKVSASSFTYTVELSTEGGSAVWSVTGQDINDLLEDVDNFSMNISSGLNIIEIGLNTIEHAFNADKDTSTIDIGRDDVIAGLNELSLGIDRIKDMLDDKPFSYYGFDTSIIGDISDTVNRLSDMLGGKSYPIADGKTICPLAWFDTVPGDGAKLILEYYSLPSSVERSSYTFSGLFPSGLPQSVVDILEPHPCGIINVMISSDTLKTRMEEIEAYCTAELASDPVDPKANMTMFLVKYYSFMDLCNRKLDAVLSAVEDNDFFQFFELMEEFNISIDEVRLYVDAIYSMDAFIYTMIVKYEDNDPSPYTVTMDDDIVPVLLTSYMVTAEKSRLDFLGTMLDVFSNEGENFDEFPYDVSLNPNNLDFTGCSSLLDYMNALRASNPNFLKLKTLESHGLDGAAKIKEIGDDCKEISSLSYTMSKFISRVAYLAHEELVDETGEEGWRDYYWNDYYQVNCPRQTILYLIDKQLDFSRMVYQDFQYPLKYTRFVNYPYIEVYDTDTEESSYRKAVWDSMAGEYDFVEPDYSYINLSAWFDNVPDDILAMIEDYEYNGGTLGGLLPAGAANAIVADAGKDVFVLVGEQVSLNGENSYDSNDKSLTYQWSLDYGPATINLSGATEDKAAFIPATSGDYKLKLTVSNGINTGSDYVLVTVSDEYISKESGGEANTILFDGEVVVTIIADTVESDVAISISVDPLNRPREIDPTIITNANNKNEAAGFDFKIPGSIIEFNAYEVSTSARVEVFTHDITLTIPYKDADNDGYVDDTDPPVRENDLSVYHLNEAISEWEALDNSTVYGGTGQNYVTVEVGHFSVFVLMGAPSDSSNAIVYPNPYKPGTSGMFDAGYITFGNISRSEETTLVIYNVAGEKIKEFRNDDKQSFIRWNIALDDSNYKAASGLYYFVVTDESGDITKGKFTIIK